MLVDYFEDKCIYGAAFSRPEINRYLAKKPVKGPRWHGSTWGPGYPHPGPDPWGRARLPTHIPPHPLQMRSLLGKGCVGTAFCHADHKFESDSSSPRRGKRLTRPFMPWSCLCLGGLGGSLQEPKSARGFPYLKQFLLPRQRMQRAAVVSRHSGKSFSRHKRRREKESMSRAPGKQLEDQETQC